MKKIILATIIGAMSISASTAYAGHKYRDNGFYDRARVIHVEPVYTTVRVSVPVQDCYQQEVHRHHNGKAASTVLGGIIGGAIGHNLGKHKQAPTIAGAIIGAAVGNELGKNARHYDRVRYEDVCETSYRYEEQQRIDGYNVTYRYKGEIFNTYMKYRPGKHLRVNVHVSPVVD